MNICTHVLFYIYIIDKMCLFIYKVIVPFDNVG